MRLYLASSNPLARIARAISKYSVALNCIPNPFQLCQPSGGLSVAPLSRVKHAGKKSASSNQALLTLDIGYSCRVY